MADDARRALWMTRIQQWRESGLSQSAFARQYGFHSWQVSYWAARHNTAQMVPVSVKRRAPESPVPALTLHSPSGWIVTLPPNLPATWLGELLQRLQ